VFGRNREKVKGKWRTFQNEKSLNIILRQNNKRNKKGRPKATMRERRATYEIVIGKPAEKGSRVRYVRKGENNNKTCLKRVEWEM
jgi:hypothetical protein